MLETVFRTENIFCLFGLLFGGVGSLLLVPLAKRLARICDCIDRPDGERKLHPYPVAYFGGLAILAGFVISVLALSFFVMGTVPRQIAVLVIGGIAICFIGAIDDMISLRPLVKFLLQIGVSLFSALFGGAIEYVNFFGHTIEFGVFSVPITVLWMVLIINAVNLIDGLDGLAGGVTALESMTLMLTALLMGNVVAAIASAALCGAILGFLPYNVNRATIFMGDAGAMLIGYAMASISVFGLFKAQALFSIVVPALIFALPILDTVIAFFRRLLRGQSPFTADHAHIHHKLMDSGLSAGKSVLAIYAASAVFCLASVLFSRYTLIAILMGVLAVVFLKLLQYRSIIFGKKGANDGTELLEKEESR